MAWGGEAPGCCSVSLDFFLGFWLCSSFHTLLSRKRGGKAGMKQRCASKQFRENTHFVLLVVMEKACKKKCWKIYLCCCAILRWRGFNGWVFGFAGRAASMVSTPAAAATTDTSLDDRIIISAGKIDMLIEVVS